MRFGLPRRSAEGPPPAHSSSAAPLAWAYAGPLSVAENPNDQDVELVVWEQLRTVFDPEIPINVVDLGLVYDLSMEHLDDGSRKVYVKLTLTAPGCGMGDIMVEDARTKLEVIPTVSEAQIDLVFDPPWNQTMMSDEAKLQTGMM